MNPKLFVFILLCLQTLSCVYVQGPKDSSKFLNVTDLSDFVGSYKNLGDSGDTYTEVYLSRLIWPKDELLDHKLIDNISIARINEVELEVTAVSSGDLIRREVFTEGKDFVLENGKITLERGLDGANDIVVGASYVKSVVGLDTKGHGKYRSSGGAVGVVLLVFPVAAVGKQDVRFERIE